MRYARKIGEKLFLYFAFTVGVLPVMVSRCEGQITAGVPYVVGLRTKESVGLNEKAPLIQRYTPPLVYARWFAELIACEELPAPSKEQINRLTFWEVNAPDFQVNNDTLHTAVGVADPEVNRIYIALPFLWSEVTVKHEFLHVWLRWLFGPAYTGDHPVYFTRCGLNPF